MGRLEKIQLALSLVAVVCAGTALQLGAPPHLRLLPFVLAFSAYRAGCLLIAAKGGPRG